MGCLLEFDVGDLFPQEKISVHVQRVGQEYCEPKKRHEQRCWDTYSSLHFVLFGHGTLIAGGEKTTLSRGDVFLLYKNQPYEYYPDSVDPWSYIWVDFDSDHTEALFSGCGLSVQKPYMHVSDLSELMDLLKRFYEAYDASGLQYLNCSAYFILLLNKLIKNADKSIVPATREIAKFRRVREILTYINNNYRMELSVQKIARDNCLSVSRMMALFAEVVGMSPVVYVNRYRVSAACEMLAGSNVTIAEAAAAVGISDQLYFSRVFKKFKGMSPREYRARKIHENPYEWLREKNIDFR